MGVKVPVGVFTPGGEDTPAGVSWPPGDEVTQDGGQDTPGNLKFKLPRGQDKLIHRFRVKVCGPRWNWTEVTLNSTRKPFC